MSKLSDSYTRTDYDRYGHPLDTIYYRGGVAESLDAAATAATNDIKARGRDIANRSYKAYYGADSPFDDWEYTLGRQIGDFIDDPNPSWAGKLMKFLGPIGGTAAGGAAGYGLGSLADWFLNWMDPSRKSNLVKWLGTAAGAGLGGIQGYVRNTPDNKEQPAVQYGTMPQEKKASMFSDPRNYVLEQLSGARDIGMAEKAQAAAIIRSMSPFEIQPLASMVRAALGAGVGALVVRWLMGKGKWTTFLGGILGAVGATMATQRTSPSGLFDSPGYRRF